MQKMISVIIPVYNVEKYIEECFESLLRQVYQNYEVLIVDDGSTDNSGEICDLYCGNDERFHVIHTENEGIAAARNLAMSQMKGEYCFFLDPDDVLESDSFSYLVDLLERTGSDIALSVTRQFRGNYQEVGKETPVERIYHGHKDICEQVLFDKNDLKPLSKKMEPSRVTYEFFSCLYKTSILNKNGIRFLPISYGEDTFVCLKYLLCSKTVATSTKTTYSHRRNPTSTTFQYHPFYLSETKKYYDFYMELFEKYASEYWDQGEIAMDGQYFRRCISAIERELFVSPKSTSVREMNRVISMIRSDKKFRELFTFSNLRYTPKGIVRFILYSIKLGVYPPIVYIFAMLYKRR